MTLTIKDTPELAGQKKPGSPSPNSQKKSDQTSRTNPMCLEVYIVVRSLPGEHGNASGASGPTREEGRTVIVFDNGAVLRISNHIPSGQKIILSNQDGRDVTCMVMESRALPRKGYIEVQFIEPVDDFWGIHQSPDLPGVSAIAAPAPAFMQIASVEPARIMPGTAHVATQPKELNLPSDNAPSFKDIEGLLGMSPTVSTPREKLDKQQDMKFESSPYLSSRKSRNESAGRLQETEKLGATTTVTPSISEMSSQKPGIRPTLEGSLVSPRKADVSDNFSDRGLLASPYSSAVPSNVETRKRTTMILVGLGILLAGFGGTYYFMHRGSELTPTPSTRASESSIQKSLDAPVPGSESTVEQSQLNQGQEQVAVPESTPATSTQEITRQGSADTQNDNRAMNSPAAVQPEPALAHHQTITNLKLRNPKLPEQNQTRLTGESVVGAIDLTPTVAPGVVPGNAALPTVMRTESQPAPPPSFVSSPSLTKSVREPQLISSTSPSYPITARQANIQGTVLVSATVDTAGNVVNAKAVSGPPFLRQAAQNAVLRWKYSPVLIDGKPATAQVTVRLEFTLK